MAHDLGLELYFKRIHSLERTKLQKRNLVPKNVPPSIYARP